MYICIYTDVQPGCNLVAIWVNQVLATAGRLQSWLVADMHDVAGRNHVLLALSGARHHTL